MSAHLEAIFRNLRQTRYTITSPQDVLYNCIAFEAGETHRWWWPTIGGFWPANVPRDETLQGFIRAFGTLGYSPCDDGELEAGLEKVAIYVDEHNTPTHMARQLPTGDWVSKCGSMEDIEHETLEALEGSQEYGAVAQFLKRSLQAD
jgi:hypothetical protein